MKAASYMHHNKKIAYFVQYAGSQAGFYRGFRRDRREAEIAAHGCGVRQLGRYELILAARRGTLKALLLEAAGLT